MKALELSFKYKQRTTLMPNRSICSLIKLKIFDNNKFMLLLPISIQQLTQCIPPLMVLIYRAVKCHFNQQKIPIVC